MSDRYKVLKSAGHRIDEIYNYTYRQWGAAQARTYIEGLFDLFQHIADRDIPWQPIPAEYGVAGYQTRYEKHFVYWRELSDGAIGIAAILHERMNIGDRLVEEFDQG